MIGISTPTVLLTQGAGSSVPGQYCAMFYDGSPTTCCGFPLDSSAQSPLPNPGYNPAPFDPVAVPPPPNLWIGTLHFSILAGHQAILCVSGKPHGLEATAAGEAVDVDTFERLGR